MVRRFFPWFLSILASGCGGTPPALDHSAPPPRITAIPAAPPVVTPPPKPAEPSPPGTAAAPKVPAPTNSGPPFPPPTFPAPHARTAKPGDGVFTLLEEGAARGTGAIARTTVHPHPIKPHPYVVVVAIDLRKVDLRLVAGTEEPTSTVVSTDRRPGLVPAADLPSLIAVFNGGFMAKHGKWGMMVDGDVFLPPREDGCTVALLGDGSVRIASFPALAPVTSALRSYRQTPPCLIEGGALHPRLPAEDTARLWGAAEGGDREIRRTAIGLHEDGTTLLFAIGEWVWARDLAAAMKSAGAASAAELDINWSYTRFLLYDHSTPPAVVSTLIEKVEYSKSGYVSKPAPRDFFYLKQKQSGAPAPR
ncbi:phosphodiester glycosidase family protein [Polyangium sp. y55x31]|uniref:phosphodiester glycosidase family protein n=1 Tax=Polyangium sp. y55x31 TaxID=3042688 RepID=UPI002482B81F|nr:phosphodiester glycosidase family protein [Polyangium sp. y55x31]MDI1475212.1 phosphodiester glycosidase family protein [Polyangium sp. y55x31]